MDRDLKHLVREAAAGKGDAAGELFDEYYPRLYRYSLGKLSHPLDAEDVAAETFARVLKDIGKFRWKGGGFEAWIFRIAANLIVDRVRDRSRVEPVRDSADGPSTWTTEELFLSSEDARIVRSAVEKLPDDQREVLLLRFAGGLAAKETGDVMGRNANAVRQLQFRALAALREHLKQEVRR